MNLSTTCRRGAQVPALCGLFLALLLAAGCGPKAPPPAPSKPKTEAPKTNAGAAAQTNLSDQYTSVFEDLPPQKGKDPFFPTSRRREPAPEAVAAGNANAHVDPVLVLKAIIRTSKHSQAVINNEIFEGGEEQSVRVPNGHVRVRCLDISSNSVLIQVEGEAEPKRLLMEQKKN
jgi:hypothetical protein